MHTDTAFEFSGILKLLACVGVLYYILFAGIGVPIERDISTLSESAAAEADPSIVVAQA